jgi:hypothetical protein
MRRRQKEVGCRRFVRLYLVRLHLVQLLFVQLELLEQQRLRRGIEQQLD